MPNQKPLHNNNGLIKQFSNYDTISPSNGGTGLYDIPTDSTLVGFNANNLRLIKNNFNAHNPPSINNDINNGFSVGSKWYDLTNKIEYTCLDNMSNNAVWVAGGGSTFDPSAPVDYIELNQSANHNVTTGQLAWNSVDQTIDIGLSGGSILQVGHELLIYAHNITGFTIPNGTPVAVVAGNLDGDLHIAPASNDNINAYSTIAITTQTIENNTKGYCTKVGKVRNINTSTFTPEDKLYLGINGTITNIEPIFPLHSIELGYCLTSDSFNGIIFVDIHKEYAVEDLYNVKITNPTEGDSFIYENNRWINRNFGEITKESTGFADPDNITVTYDQLTRCITLSGVNINAYWRSNLTSIQGTTWISPPHNPSPNAPLYLYYNGTAFVWSYTQWQFDTLHIAYVGYDSSGNYRGTIRECHGTMQWQVHREFHKTIGCYVESGGDFSDYIVDSTNIIDRRPDISQTILYDEDLQTINQSLTSKLYTQVQLTNANERIYTINTTDIIQTNGTRPYWNQFIGGVWTQTLMSNNTYACIYVIAAPTASDTLSQHKRYVFIQPQKQFSSSSEAQDNKPNSINMGDKNTLSPEFVFIAKIIIHYTANNWTLIAINKLTGNQTSQTEITGNFLSSVAHDSTLTGDGTPSSPLSVSSSLSTSPYFYIHSALMGSATSTLGFFSLHPQNANPFDNALTTAYDVYNNRKLNPILMPFNWKLSEIHLALGHCAIAQGTVGSNPTLRIEFFSHSGTSRSSIGFVDVPIDNNNCGIYNNLGNNNFQSVSVVDISNITGNINDLIGWQFTNRGITNNQINSVAQVTIETKFDKA